MKALRGMVAVVAIIIGLILIVVAIVDIATGKEGFSMWVGLAVGLVLAVLGLPGLGANDDDPDGWNEHVSQNALRIDTRDDDR